jgi:uncharacterized RDD family membrane protein YckC
MHDDFQTPSLLRRMACWLYEGILIFAVMFTADYLFSTLTQTRNAMDNRHAQQAFLFLVFGIYFVWFWSHGQTLAMKTWNIRVTDLQGNTISQKRALLRYTLSWVWFLPPLAVSWLLDVDAKVAFLLAGSWIPIWAVLSRFHPQKQFWHDAFAGTRLMSFRHPPAKRAS